MDRTDKILLAEQVFQGDEPGGLAFKEGLKPTDNHWNAVYNTGKP